MSGNLVPQTHQLDFQGQGFQAVFIGQTCWFNAKAVCDILDLRNVSDAVGRLEPEERSNLEALLAHPTLGGTETHPEPVNSLPPELAGIRRDALYVNEAGLYSLVFRSNKPQAKKFRLWVTNKVLPCIREYGCYPKPSNPNQLSLVQASEKLLGLEKTVKGMDQRLDRFNDKMVEQSFMLANTMRELHEREAQDPNHGWISLSGWHRKERLRVDTARAAVVGRELSAFCRAKGVEPRRIPDQQFGYINIYPEDLINEYMDTPPGEVRRVILESHRETYHGRGW